MEYKWNPITDEMRKTLDGAPMIGCMVWISYTDEYGNMDVMFARLETKWFGYHTPMNMGIWM